MLDRRHDTTTASIITEALRMKSAFGLDAARRFLWRRKIADTAPIAGRYDRRQRPG